MPKFFYVAKDKSGKKITGIDEGANSDELIARLQAGGLVVLEIKLESEELKAELKAQVSGFGRRRQHLRITADDLSLFCRQLATLLSAGVPVLEALGIIARQTPSRRLANVIGDLMKKMEAGLSLHEAMSKNRSVFSGLWTNLVESGEASGSLAVVLSRLANYLERDARFRAKIISALIYPAILMAVGLCALLFLTLKIIPTFASLFDNFDMKLPLVTQILIAVSIFVRKGLLLIIIANIGAVFLFRAYLRHPEYKKKYQNFLLRLPIFGDFYHNLLVERFSSEMATLVESGVPILYSLEIAERSVDNLVMAEVIRNIKEEVRQGHSLSTPMQKSGFFEPMVIQMVHIGEEIGDLSGMLKKVNAFYQEYVETFLTRFTAMFEPIMLVLMGIIIGIMVIGMFLPIFQISQLGMR